MPIELRTFASGDTDYIAKLNSNVSTLTDAIDGLQAQAAAAGAGSAASAGQFISMLFNQADGLIGPSAYKPTQNPTTLSIAPGGMYLDSAQSIVVCYSTTTLNLAGQTSGTKYIVVDASGNPMLGPSGPGAVYSVQWTGSGFTGIPVRLVPVFFDTVEADASRKSTTLAVNYDTLDLRLEAGEAKAKSAQTDATTAIGIANDTKGRLDQVIAASGAQRYRKVGVTIDNVPGNKGAIQLDFYGKIVGWSVIADKPGNLQVEVSKKASSPPPAVPAIPDLVADKISASTPITLTTAQAASRAAPGVASWTTAITPWDVMQFNVIAVDTISRATLYVRIQEDPPVQSVALPFIASTLVVNAPPFLVAS